MVSIGISEFTFGFAFLNEQTRRNWGNLVAAPILPSLQHENDLGWDAHLPVNGIDYYYQFKLSDYLRRRHATFIKDGTYNSPYFKITLHSHDNNRQHRLLKLYAETNPHTYYVAPEIDLNEDFNEIFLEERITEASRIIPISHCDDVTDCIQHYITFQKDNPDWRFHSESKLHKGSIFGREINKHYEASVKEHRAIDDSFFRNILSKTIEKSWTILEAEGKRSMRRNEPVMRLLDYNFTNQSRTNILKRTSLILSAVFGLTLVIVGEKNTES